MEFSSDDTVSRMAAFFAALGHRLSVSILRVMLFESEGGRLTTFNFLCSCRSLSGNQSDAIRESVSCLERVGILRRVDNFGPEAFVVVNPNLITSIFFAGRTLLAEQDGHVLRSGYMPQPVQPTTA